MEHLLDELSMAIAAQVPRRESMRRLGAVFAGAVLAPLGINTAWAARPAADPCKALCKCRGKANQAQCLDACRACNGATSRVCGSCGSYACCSSPCCNGACVSLTGDPNCGACGNNCGALGKTCCTDHCADLQNDVNNCGSCGVPCDPPGANEYVSCVAGACVYECDPFSNTERCNGACINTDFDDGNCGACGNACGGTTPHCNYGVCTECGFGETLCGGVCIDTTFDNNNCGTCGWQCDVGAGEFCWAGSCITGF